MRFQTARTACLAAGLLAACTPTYNWREIRFEGAPLFALLPCKPDEGKRPAALGGASGSDPIMITMKGCETGGVTFAVGWADAGDPARAAGLMARWKAATLSNLQAGAPPEQSFAPAGAGTTPAPVRVAVTVPQAGGKSLAAHAAWFARGAQVFQALAVGPYVDANAADTFFSGLRLQ